MFGDDTHVYMLLMLDVGRSRIFWHKNSIESNDMRVFRFEEKEGTPTRHVIDKKEEHKTCHTDDVSQVFKKFSRKMFYIFFLNSIQ